MEIKSTQKFIRTSPRKLREVAGMIRGLTPDAALEMLPHIEKRAAQPLLKVVKSAIANAKVKGVASSELTFKEVQIGEGPTLKRGRPAARGAWHPILKRMSHIRIVVASKPKQVKKKKPTKKIEKKEAKSK